MGEDLDQTKRLLRRRFLAARRELPAEVAAALARAVCARVARLPQFLGASHVVAYAAIDNEVDPADVVATAVAAGKPVYYPRIGKDGLEFLRAEPHTLATGRGRIPEPTSGAPLPHGGQAVLFLVPGVAFDRSGVRLGRGAGCYDRALGHYPDAVRIGLAYELQMVSALPMGPTDVRMHAVATEARLVTAGQRAEACKERQS